MQCLLYIATALFNVDYILLLSCYCVMQCLLCIVTVLNHVCYVLLHFYYVTQCLLYIIVIFLLCYTIFIIYC